jgi:hyaluronan synthase
MEDDITNKTYQYKVYEAFFSFIRRENWEIKMNKFKEAFLLLIFLSLVTALILYKAVFITNMSLAPSFWTIYGLIATVFLISRIPYAYLHNDDHSKVYSDSAYPNVSIIIAAKNEEAGIFRTITTCVESKYSGKIECIVIDDGSTDGTKGEVIRAQKFYGGGVRLISFPKNRGKREAMAIGISESLYEIIIFVDSDSFLAPDAVRHITEHFLANKKIGAVSGNTKAENANTNLLTKMQSIQYAVSFDIYKASESVHHSVTCCPGCFSAYRKSTIEPLAQAWKEHKFLGSKSTFGDDRGLTNFVLKNGWDIVYCEKARASTVVPEKFSVYWRQQLRWKKSWIREGLFAGTFMWKKRHPLASFAFYTNFSFPIVGPILAGSVLINSITTHNPLLFIVFMSGFMLLGTVFALFARVYLKAENWMYMPLVSLLFISVFIWQMPWALITLRKTHWGTR